MEPSGFREIARSATVTYPVPFAFSLLLAFSVLTLGGAIITEAPLRWVLVGFAGTSFAVSVAMLTLSAIWKPELLRSERHQITHRVLDLIADNDLGPDTLDVGRLILDDHVPKKSVSTQGTAPRQQRGDHGRK